MHLPRGDDYNQAVQFSTSFEDKQLRLSKVENTPLGIPKPYSGGFTTTYKLYDDKNKWAVRCFTKEIHDLPQRYSSISRFLNLNSCSFMVEAKYLNNGIKVGNQFQPVVKMTWVDGVPLNEYIDKYYNQKNKLEILLREFTNLVRRLENLGIAHGDLQHGNILVKNDKIFLIDYDGMYLPDLSNLKVNELGHPNFQHPRRSLQDYSMYIDRFSSIVIYTAIKAIIEMPQLWLKYENGDNLLFKASDFTDSKKSGLLYEIGKFNSEFARLASNITSVCSLRFTEIPSLQEFISGKIASSSQILPQITTIRNAYFVLDGRLNGQMSEHIGERVEVVGQITNTFKGTTKYGLPYVFMNMGGEYPDQTFGIAVWDEGISALKSRNLTVNSLVHQWISIIGVLSSHNGNIQMILDTPSQIQVLTEKNALDKLNFGTFSSPINSLHDDEKIKQISKEDQFWNKFLIESNQRNQEHYVMDDDSIPVYKTTYIPPIRVVSPEKENKYPPFVKPYKPTNELENHFLNQKSYRHTPYKPIEEKFNQPSDEYESPFAGIKNLPMICVGIVGAGFGAWLGLFAWNSLMVSTLIGGAIGAWVVSKFQD